MCGSLPHCTLIFKDCQLKPQKNGTNHFTQSSNHHGFSPGLLEKLHKKNRTEGKTPVRFDATFG